MADKENTFVTQKDLALSKMKKYCAYRERCHSEVRYKLLSLEIYGDDLEEIIADLIIEKYLSEDRYAKAYARGKFRINHWGKNKIIAGLKAKSIPQGLITSALLEIDEEEYKNTLNALISKKARTLRSKNAYDKKQKLSKFALTKGYEYAFIKEALEEITIE